LVSIVEVSLAEVLMSQSMSGPPSAGHV